VNRRRDEDEQGLHGEAVNARVNEQVREARDEVFRAYVRAREQGHRLADEADGDDPPYPLGPTAQI
jgi:hypothetical protein